MDNPGGGRDDRQSRDGLLGRFKAAVSSTRRNLVARMDQVLQGRKAIDPELLEEIEEILVGADAELVEEGEEEVEMAALILWHVTMVRGAWPFGP